MDCELKDITVYYEEVGDGRPVLMIHGWSVNRYSMLCDMEPLFKNRPGWKRIYLDLPGHGRTPGKNWITNQDKLLEVVLDFIDKVIPKQRFVVAGVSAGAYLARGIFYHRSAFLDGLLLVVPMIVAEDAKRRVPAHITLVKEEALMAGLNPDAMELINQLAVVQSQKWIDAVKTFTDPAYGTGDQEFQAGIRENPENYAFTFEADAISKPCSAPTFIVTGRQIPLLATAMPGKSSRIIQEEPSQYWIAQVIGAVL